MQVKIKQESRVFKPITLEITFDRLEDAQLFERMLAHNISVPSVVYTDDAVRRKELADLMRKIREPLTEELEKQKGV